MSVYVNETKLFSMSKNITVFGSPLRSNISFIRGSKYNLLVDSGQNEDHVSILFDLIGKVKIDYSVLTHFHQDHTLGLAYLDCVGIGHKNIIKNLLVYKGLDHSDEGIQKQINERKIPNGMYDWYRREYPDRSKLQVILPSITYDKHMSIDLGNLTIELEHIACDHTNDTTIVYIPSDEALFLGDCLSPDSNQKIHIPVFRSILNYLLSFDSKIMVEGHGPPLGNGKGNNYLNDLMTITDFVEENKQESIQKIDLIYQKMTSFDKDSLAVYLPLFVNGL